MITTRFAPSPTGYLHIGGLRTALYSYLWARKNSGEFKLRIEDTDMERNNDDAMKAIIEAFDWVGLNYDAEVTFQSKRLELYQQYIKQLLDEGKAYNCYMSRDELDALRQKQMENKMTPKYDETWRPEENKVLPKIPEGVEPVVRIKSPKDGVITFEDGVKNTMNFDYSEVDDFVIARSNGIPTYNFVVAIDDALMNISDVIRGDDHLTNTPKQIVIYEALGFTIPKFHHVPMINNPAGKKLSKRDGAMDVMEYKRKGYLPEALLNFLVRLGWSNKDQEIFSMDEMLSLFTPLDINKSASAYNEEKLLWLNSHYIKTVSNERLIEELKAFDCDLDGVERCEILLDISKQRAQTLVELKESIEKILKVPTSYEAKGVKKFIKENTNEFLKSYLSELKENKESFNLPEDYELITKPFIEKNELKFPQLFQPIRIALTGSTQAPSVYEIMAVLGFDEVYKRLTSAIDKDFDKE